jgi:murein DD-endopeptidase MepM/ murein hydrolase activator NlpD
LYDRINELEEKADSLELQFRQKSLYVYNLKRILEGEDTVAQIPEQVVADTNYEDIRIVPSKEDSMLRADFEYRSMYNLFLSRDKTANGAASPISTFNFFTPLNGIVTNNFNPAENHFGIDIVAKKDEAVKATLDGIVIFADWTLETGNVICLQHKNNIISIYKHNSTLLKDQGSFVKAGEPISIVGASGELSTGPHLHFEIWFNGVPVDPSNLMIF